MHGLLAGAAIAGQHDGARVVDLQRGGVGLRQAHLGEQLARVHDLDGARRRRNDLGLGRRHCDARLTLTSEDRDEGNWSMMNLPSLSPVRGDSR